MTKKVQVHLEDELVTELKIFALKQGKPVKEVIAEAIINHLGRNETTNTKIPKVLRVEKVQESNVKSIEVLKDTNTKIPNSTNVAEPLPSIIEETKGVHETLTNPAYSPEPDYDDPFGEYDPMDERYFYILKKTHTLGVVNEGESEMTTNGALWWEVPVGHYKNFDKDGILIPFRSTSPEGRVTDPTEEQKEQIAKKYGKQGVTVEV